MEEHAILTYTKKNFGTFNIRALAFFKDKRVNELTLEEVSEYTLERAINIQKLRYTDTDNTKVYNRMALYYLLKPSKLEPQELEYYKEFRTFIMDRVDVNLANVF